MPSVKWRKFQVGTGTGRAGFVGLLPPDISARATSTATETTIASVTLPAGSLYIDGAALRISGLGTFAATAGAKTVKLKFGSVTLVTYVPTTVNGGGFVIAATIVRTSSGHQVAYMQAGNPTNKVESLTINSTLAEADTAPIPILLTGTAAAGADVITCTAFLVETLMR